MIDDILIIERDCFGDERGSFSKLFVDVGKPIVQVNHSVTHEKGTTRGLHYQKPPYAEIKIISCIRGFVYDVSVDLRRDSKTFLQWFSHVLSEENRKTIVIPEGFAHGFQVMSDDAELIYLHTNYYVKEAEAGLHVLDKALGIVWPFHIRNLSERDKGFRFIDDGFEGVRI